MEDSTPLTTVENIQKRLIRPSLLRSPTEGLNASQLKQSGEAKRKLEDYLDPVLLAAVSSRIGGSKKPKTETKLKGEVKGFDWPMDELKVFVEENSSNANRGSWRNSKTVDLNSDFDVIGDARDGDVNDDATSPFNVWKNGRRNFSMVKDIKFKTSSRIRYSVVIGEGIRA